jgi:PAS domain S-box-containing protein
MGLFKKGNSKDIMDNELYEGLFQHYPDGIFSLDSFDSIQEVNEQFAQRLGYGPVELNHSSFSAIVHLDDIKRYLSCLKEVLNGVTKNIQVYLLHKNGQQVLTILTLIPIRKNENVTGINGFTKDVQRRSEDLTTGTEVYTKESMDHAQRIGNFGFWEYDFAQKEFYCSEQMCIIFRLDSTNGFKMTYESFTGCIHLNDRDKVEYNLDQAIFNGTFYEHEYRIDTELGERYIHSQGTAIKDKKGNIIRIIGTVH